MRTTGEDITCELVVVGSGMAGMAASVFAANRGIDLLQVGVTAEINFASGLIDLLGVHPLESGRVRKNPWRAIAELVRDIPDHPFARLTSAQIRSALEEFLSFLKDAGQPYVVKPEQNVRLLTPLGTVKTTYAVPQSMAPGIDALSAGSPCLLVDFKGLKGFSARQIVENIGDRWTALRWTRIDFPRLEGELFPEKMAWALEKEEVRQELIRQLRPRVGDAGYIALPAVLGIFRTGQVIDHLQAALGARVFEIPTMVPAVTGLRLQEAITNRLREIGVRTRYQQTVTGVEVLADRSLRLTIGGDGHVGTAKSRAILLATGRFYGKGLQADRRSVRESLLDLPVHQPGDRSLWHRRDFLHPAGHPLNLAGLRVDNRFRPADAGGKAVYPTVFAAGSVLAHQDWTRQKCGSGLAIATAYGAVDGYCRTRS